MPSLPSPAASLFKSLAQRGHLVVLTGAGVSAESGIPTFRGPEGLWTVGSKNYHPEELATRAAFEHLPRELWGWYLYRRAVCLAALPNRGHRALAKLEQLLANRLVLVTQNVDGLHLRAGNSKEHTWQIHGNLHWTRCAAECGAPLQPVPAALDPNWERGRLPTREELAHLACSCGSLRRPHVLWFDECYDEDNFRFDSALRAVGAADLLLVVGSSGSTNLPMQMARGAAVGGVPIVVVDPEPNPFSELQGGPFLQGAAGEWLPVLVQAVLAGLTSSGSS